MHRAALVSRHGKLVGVLGADRRNARPSCRVMSVIPPLEFPLLRRELLGLLRTRRAFWLAFVFAALAVAAPIFSWPSRDVAAVYSEENRGVFMVFAVLQLTLAMFI